MVKQKLNAPLNQQRSKVFLAQTNLAVSVVLFFVKYWAFHLTESQALFSDAMETVVNIAASALGLWVIIWAAQPADKQHPYGHGKAEFLSAAFEGGLIFFAALVIIVSSLQALWHPPELQQLELGLVVSLAAALINGAMGWLMIYRGREMNSAAILASGQHLLTDLWTTLGVLAGLVVVKITGIIWLDSVLAILVALHLLWVGYKLFQGALSGLLDATQGEYITKFNSIINEPRPVGIIQIHHTRMIVSGDYHHIDAHVVMPEYWDIKKTHDKILDYEKQVFEKYGSQGEIHFHVDPCERAYCKNCADAECPVRREAFVAQRSISVDEMIDHDEPGLLL